MKVGQQLFCIINNAIFGPRTKEFKCAIWCPFIHIQQQSICQLSQRSYNHRKRLKCFRLIDKLKERQKQLKLSFDEIKPFDY